MILIQPASLPKFLLWFLIIGGFGFSELSECQGQNNGHNIGFETGTFSGWTAFTGQCCPVYTPFSGFDPGRHAIMSGTQLDPLSAGLIPVVSPFTVYSARIGNEANDAEAEALEYTFTVPSDSLLLAIRFAVLLEDGLHPETKQPRFSYKVTSASGHSLTGCTETEVIAGSSYPEMIKMGTLEILPWQSRYVNLTGHSGQTVTIRFETGDCGPGGHFGYAYVDCELIPAKITVSNCFPDGSIQLSVTPGLTGLWYDGSAADSLIIAQPSPGSVYQYELNQNLDCSFPISVNGIDFGLPVSEFSFQNKCDQIVEFSNHSSFLTGSWFEWNFGDGANATVFEPAHQYLSAGNYNASLTVVQPDGCRSEQTEVVLIDASPQFEITESDFCPMQNISVAITSLNSGHGFADCMWFVNNREYTGCNISVNFQLAGVYPLTVIITDNMSCVYEYSNEIAVIDSPDCYPGTPVPYIPLAFTPNNDGINDIFRPEFMQGIEDLTMTIYNRYGQIVCENYLWDGTYLGKNCPQGVYAYRLNYTVKSRKLIKSGTVLLIR
jgi:gliding motility-associated-like protein